MKILTSSHFFAALAGAFFTLLGIVAAILLGGCTALDDYDRSYSLSYSDGKQTVAAGATFRPRGPYAVPLAQ